MTEASVAKACGALLLGAMIGCACAMAQNAPPPVSQDQSQQSQSQQDQTQPSQPSPEQATPAQTSQEPQQNQTSPNQPQQNQTSSEPPQNQSTQNPPPPGQTGQEQPGQGQTGQEQKDTSKGKVQDIPGAVGEATKKFGELTLNKVVDWETGWFIGPYVGKNRPLVLMTAQQRRRIYLDQTFAAPSDYFKRMVSAAFDQMRNSPSQWGQGWGAYGERFASREGQFIAANSLAAFGDAALKYEPRYDQCKCSGLLPRTRHAILRNFLTYNQSERELRPQWALYGGAFAGGVIASAWKPRPQNVLLDGMWGVVGQAGYGAMYNFFTEFAGDINRKLKKKMGLTH